jgi:hypothetical protein
MARPVQQLNAAGDNEPTNEVPAAIKRRGPLTARDRAERWILAILLNEPSRWFDLQQHVQLHEFTDETRRQLAEVYWQHQRDEGEPVFNEFLGLLTDPAAAELAVELIEESETLTDADARLKEAIGLLKEMRGRDEQQKLLAELRRTNAAANGANAATGDEDDPLRKLQEKARQPDLRRVGG